MEEVLELFVGEGVLAQATDYYPFGKSFENNDVPKNRYLYNGKELQDQVIGGTLFGWYDYGARFYDAEGARFISVDPLAEKYSWQSPYAYAANNPVRFIDWMGMGPGDANEDPLLAARFVKNLMQDFVIGAYNTVTWLGAIGQPIYNPVRSVATKVQGDDGYYHIEKTTVVETLSERLAGVIDPLSVVATFAGGRPAAFMAKTESSTSVSRTIKYEVGAFNDLKAKSVVGDKLDIHHVGQQSPMKSLVDNYDPKTAPAIAAPKSEHQLIPTIKGEFNGNARQLLAKDISDLRKFTSAPFEKLKD